MSASRAVHRPSAPALVDRNRRLLGSTLTITAPPRLAAQLEVELASLWTVAPPGSDAGRPTPHDQVILDDDGRAVRTPAGVVTGGAGPADATDRVQLALTEITRAAIAVSPLLCVHAGVVTAPAGATTIAFPGMSGHGKTTLVAALVQRGFEYVSDEVLALDRSTARIEPFARPLALDRNSWDLLTLDRARRPEAAGEQLARPAELGRGAEVIPPLGHVVLFERRSADADDSGVTVERLARGRAVHALLLNSFNHFADPAASFHQIAAVVRGAAVWRLRYQEADAAADALADRWN